MTEWEKWATDEERAELEAHRAAQAAAVMHRKRLQSRCEARARRARAAGQAETSDARPA